MVTYLIPAGTVGILVLFNRTIQILIKFKEGGGEMVLPIGIMLIIGTIPSQLLPVGIITSNSLTVKSEE